MLARRRVLVGWVREGPRGCGKTGAELRMAQLMVFLGATFALAWAIFFSVDARGGLNPLFLLGVFAPSISAVLVSAWRGGAQAVRTLLTPLGRIDVAARWYAFAVLFMASIKLAAAAGVRLIDGAWPPSGVNPALIPFAILLSTPVQAGEEIGWRGFALPRLAERFGMRMASVLLGVIWAVWHLPLFYVAGADTMGQSFPVYLAQIVAVSVAMAWLYAHTGGSLLLAMLMHSSINQVSLLIPAAIAPSPHPWTVTASAMSWLTLILLWVSGAYFLMRMPREVQ